MLWLSTCHFMSHLVQHVPMTALIILGLLFQVIHPGSLSILQKRFKSSRKYLNCSLIFSVLAFTGLSLPPLQFLVDHFSSVLPPIQVRVSAWFLLPSVYTKKSVPKEMKSGRCPFPTLWDQHYRRCEKMWTVHWAKNWSCLAFKTGAVSDEPI